MNTQNQLGKTVLFISDLPENIVDSDLETFFSDYKSNILMIQVEPSGKFFDAFKTRSPRATIVFKDHEKAAEAREALNMLRLKGKTLNIMWHEKDNNIRYNNTANLFVKKISREIKPRQVYEVFSKYGEIISSKICEDENGNSLGYGYINYYSFDSSEKAIKDLNNKEMWGNVLEIEYFKKKNERLQSYINNSSIYVKNIQDKYTENDIKKVFQEYGTITWSKLTTDELGRKYAILVYLNQENAIKAKESLNGKKLKEDDSDELYVDLLQKKNERKRILTNKIGDINSKLNQDFKDCNLYIKNLPKDITESQLHEIFSKYGEIKSSKIQKFILVTKENGKVKEMEEPSGFGFVCYLSPESANKAIQDLNGKNLPGYEDNKKPPVLINYFMPKNQRKQMLSRIQGESVSRFPLIMGSYPPVVPFSLGMYGVPIYQGRQPVTRQFVLKRQPHPANPANQRHHQRVQQQQPKENKEDEPNLEYMQSLGDLEAQQEYIGEFLFRKIEQHPIAHQRNFTVDTIGKITGMILNIKNIVEIYNITINHESLTMRINEAVKLLLDNPTE
jgi:polyadenylate-binding protein